MKDSPSLALFIWHHLPSLLLLPIRTTAIFLILFILEFESKFRFQMNGTPHVHTMTQTQSYIHTTTSNFKQIFDHLQCEIHIQMKQIIIVQIQIKKRKFRENVIIPLRNDVMRCGAATSDGCYYHILPNINRAHISNEK